MRPIVTALLVCAIPLALSACDAEHPSTDSSDPAPERGAAGKADAPGSCEPEDCGGQASIGSCWCDELCTMYNDCCADKANVCDGEPEPTPEPTPEPAPEPELAPQPASAPQAPAEVGALTNSIGSKGKK